MRLYINTGSGGTLTEIDLNDDIIGLVMNRNAFKIELKQDRSFSLTIAATPSNNSAFNLSNQPYSDVIALHTTYYGQLHYSGGYLEGQLLITKATRDSYTATFYYNGNTNETVDAKLATYLVPADFDPLDYVIWTQNPTYTNGSGALPLPQNYGLYKYRVAMFNQGDPLSNTTSRLPCVGYKYLTELAAAKLGCTVNFDISEATELAQKLERYERMLLKTITHNGRRNVTIHTDYEWGETSPTGMGMSGSFSEHLLPRRQAVYYYDGSNNIVGSVGVEVFVSQYNSTVTVTQLMGTYGGIPIASFIYSTDMRTWNPLTVGTQIHLEVGETLMVANGAHGNYPQYDDIMFGGVNPGDDGWYIELSLAEVLPIDVDTPGIPYIYLYDNIPDISLADLLKTLAYELNLGLYFNPDTRQFVLTDLKFPSPQPLPDEIEGGCELSITTEMLNGRVYFDSSKFVIAQAILFLGNGDNKVIYKIPFSEERIATVSTMQDVLIDDIAAPSTGFDWSGQSDKVVLCMYNDDLSSQYLRRIDFMSGRLSGLMSSGCSVKVKVYQTAFEFSQLTPTTCFFWNAYKWGILSAKNSGNVTELQLVRLDEIMY